MATFNHSFSHLDPYLPDYPLKGPSHLTSGHHRFKCGKRCFVNEGDFWSKVGQGPHYRRLTIEALPDDALLEVFDFYMIQANRIEAWCTLVHVCHRWRKVVFASPRRLNLQLVCTSRTPVKRTLDVWPTLPIVVETRSWESIIPVQLRLHMHNEGVNNIIAALGRRARVSQIVLCNLPPPLLDMFSTMMQESFLALTCLRLESTQLASVLPDSFLGGSAPRLRSLSLKGIPFPALPNLLLSTNDLVDLRLLGIPNSGYISPKAMVTCLSSLTRLEIFYLGFHSPQSFPHRSIRHLTRVDLPTLTYFSFRGVGAYMEDFVAQINAPLLHYVGISFFNQLLFDVSQLTQFIGRVEGFKTLHQAAVHFGSAFAYVILSPFESAVNGTKLVLDISCTNSEWQLSSLAEVSSSSSSPIRSSPLERLYILIDDPPPEHWHDDMDDTQWVELLQPFTVVKDLYLCEELAQRVTHALHELTGEAATQVLPALQSIFIKGNQLSWAVLEAIGPFVAARQLSGHPVAVRRWEES